MTETIGTARLDVVVDTSTMEAGLARAQNAVTGFSTSAQAEYHRLSAAEKRRADALIRQSDLVGKAREQQQAYNAVLKVGGTLGAEIAQKILAQANAQKELVAAQERGAAIQAEATRRLQQEAAARDKSWQAVRSQFAEERRLASMRANAIAAFGTELSARERASAAAQRQAGVHERLNALLATERGRRILAAQAATAHAAAAGKATVAFNQYGLSAKQQAAALRQVPAQVTDIFTSLASGQRPLTVLLQQGGQLKDVFGGVTPALRAMGGALAGLINPITIALVAVGGLAVAWKQGADEAHAFNRALDLTGNFAGTTAARLQSMSAALADSNVTQGQAADALAKVASTGKFTAEQLHLVTEAALQMQVATGKAVEDTVAEFAKLADDPVRAVVELNNKYHFLTASVYDQIKALQDQGREQEAATLAIEEFGRVSADRARQAAADADWITKAWRGVKHGIADAFDSLRNFGRLQSEVGKANYNIAKAREQLLTIEGRLRGEADDGTATLPRVEAYKKRIDQLKKIIQDSQKVLAGDPSLAAAARRSQQQQANDALIQIREITESHATAEEKRGKRIAREIGLADEAIKKARATGNADLIKQAEAARATLAAAHAREEKQEVSAPRTSGGGRSTSRGSAGRALPDFAGKAEEELARLAQAEARATETFKDMEAQLQGPLAVAMRDHQKRVAELNALAAQSPEASARLSEALALEAKRHEEVTREIEAQSDPMRLLLEDMRLELETIGMTNAERAVMIELRRQNIDAMSAEGREALATARMFDEEARAKERSIDLMDRFRDGAADALSDFVTGAKSAKDAFKDFFDSIAEAITRAIAEQWMQKLFGGAGTDGSGTSGGDALGGILGALFGGGGSSSGSIADLFSGGWGFAKGAAFAGGNVIPFAHGGVIDSPMNFPMSGGRLGLMGEAGPEAIMPLHRGSDGKLGVRMEGGGNVSLQQTFIVQGTPDRRTSEQMARSSGREARRGMARTGG